MWIFYACAAIPIFIGLILHFLDKKIIWQEWLIGAGSALALAIIFNCIAVGSIHSKTADKETWSGKITHNHHFSKWEEAYQEAIYRTEHYTTTETETDSDGKEHEVEVDHTRQVFDHWEDETRWHYDSYTEYSDIDTSYEEDLNRYNYIVNKFGKEISVAGSRTTGEHDSHMIGGDPNDYEAVNINNWIEPVTKLMSFENRVKATPNLFAFSKVPTNIPVYNWPTNPDYNHSQRLMGNALALIDPLKFDQLNSKLGASKKVNIIMIGFGNKGEEMGHYQESKFFGGRKNDLVITFGGGTRTNGATWAYVFGFTEREIVKQNIETILLNNPINDNILNNIELEVRRNYVIKDWKKFNYLSVSPSDWVYGWYFGLMFVIQIGLYIFFRISSFRDNFINSTDYSDFGTYNRYGRRRY